MQSGGQRDNGVQCNSMDAAGQERSLVVLAVYWFLAVIALLFAIAALWQVNRVRTRKPVEVRVIERTMRVEVREMSGKRGRYKTLFAVANLRLERLDSHAVVTHKEEWPISKDAFVSLEFLDPLTPGTVKAAEERDGQWALDPASPWLIAGVLGICAWLFGAFAWVSRSAVDGGGMGLRILALAVIPVGVAAYGIGVNVMKEKAENALQRVPVDGRPKEILVSELVKELEAVSVKAGEDVRNFFGDAEEKVQYTEYFWQGKPLRAVSLWCQAPESGVCEIGRAHV